MVALQGTLETFSLPDVLQLLASTKKSGCLRVSGDRGDGSVWVLEGAVVASEASGAPHADSAVDVVFELLRFGEGEFVFEDGGEAPEAGSPAEVGGLLEQAGGMLDEWRAIEAVVPSADHWVGLAASLPGDEVTLDGATWGAVVAVGGGRSVHELGELLELGELPVARLVKQLREQGLVEIDEPRAPAPAAEVAPAPEPEPEPEPEPAAAPEPVADEGYEPFDPDALVIDDGPLAGASLTVVGDAADDTIDDAATAADTADDTVVDDIVIDEPAAAVDPADTTPVIPEPGEAAEIARQLANLSPKAARAVAAAAKAATPEERDQYLAEVEASDDQINRELLLKFLGTVG